MLKTQQTALTATVATIFRPRPKQSVTEWCEAQLSMTTDVTAMAGPYRTTATPYVREVLDLFSDFSVEKVVCCFGAQTAKTQTFLCGLAWAVANEPSPIMLVLPNKTLAESISDKRLKPLLNSSAEIAEMRDPKKREKKTEFSFEGSSITLVGSNSPANLASRPARILMLDEVDKYPMATKREANALSLAKERTMSFPEPKIFESSTPTTGDGLIWSEFLDGDQRRYFVPCPHCGKQIILTLNPARSAFPQLNGSEAMLCWDPKAKRKTGEWDFERVAITAHFVCPFCKGKIYNAEKTKMLRLGEWKPTNPFAKKNVRSYHLPTFYAPWAKANWGALAVEFLTEKHSIGGLKNFINSKCAEPDIGQWEGDGGGRRELIVLNPSDSNKPAKRVRFLTADRQKDYFYWLVREWYAGGDSLLIEWGKADTFDDLKAVADRLQAKVVGVDNGFEAVDTNKNCAAFDSQEQHWFALRGDGRENWPHYDRKKRRIEKPFTYKRIDPLIGTKNEGSKYIWLLMWSNPTVKDLVARFREPKQSPVKWAITQKFATDEYFRQLNGEYRKKEFNPKTGKARQIWVLRGSGWDNHLLDCECMNIAFALYFEILKTNKGSADE